MSNGLQNPDCTEPVEDRVDILFRELELAIKWHRPSLLLAIYSSETAHGEAEAKLSNGLNRLGYQVIRLENRTNNFGDYASQVADHANIEKTVFFANSFDWASLRDQKYDHNTFEQSRDFFIGNKVRIVFWLTEANASALAHHAPDFWTFRHCSVEFIEMVEFVKRAEESAGSQPDTTQALSKDNGPLLGTVEEAPVANGAINNDQNAEYNINLLLTLGVMHWRKGEHEKAIEILESALKLGEQLQSHWIKALCSNSLALVQTSMGKIEEAIKTYEQAQPIAHPSIFPWSNLGNLYSKVKRDEEAIKSFLKAIEVNSRDAISWNGLGDVYIRNGKTEDAISAYQKAIEYAPYFAPSWNGLGNAYMSAGHPETAVNAYQRTIELDKNLINPWTNLGNIYKKQNNSDEAIKAYLKAMEIDPKDAGIRVELGNLFYSQGNIDEAVKSYNKAMELDPGYGMAYSNLAVLYTRLGKYSDAIPLYQKSIELLQLDSDRTVLWDRLGETIKGSNSSGKTSGINDLSNEHILEDKEEFNTSQAGDAVSTPIETVSRESIESVQDQAAVPVASDIRTEGPMEDKKGITPLRSAPITAASADSYEISHEIAAGEQPTPDSGKKPVIQQSRSTPAESSGKTDKSNRIRFGWKFGNPFTFSAHSKRTPSPKPAPNLVILNKGQSLEDRDQSTERMADASKNGSVPPESYPQGMVNASKDDRSPDYFITGSHVAGDDMRAYSSADVHTEIDFINAQEWNEIGKVYFSLGDMEQAILTFNKAIEMNPKFGWPYSNMALAYTQQGRFEEAIFVYKKSIELFRDEKNKAIAWNRLGNVYLRIGNDDRAISAYRMADQLDAENGVSEPSSGDLLPEFESYNAHVWNEVGRIYYNKNIYDKAIEAYQKAIHIDPGLGWSYSNLALAFSHQGRYAEAIPLYNKSIELFRNDRDKALCWNRLGDTYRHLNDRDNALAAYEMAVGLDPDNNTLLKRARFSLLSNCAAR